MLPRKKKGKKVGEEKRDDGDGKAAREGGKEIDAPGDVAHRNDKREELAEDDIERIAGRMRDAHTRDGRDELSRILQPDSGREREEIDHEADAEDEQGD